MSSEGFCISLSQEEIKYILEEDEILLSLLNVDKNSLASTGKLNVAGSLVEETKEHLSLILAKKGFDADYVLTKSGRILESLLAKLATS